MMDASHAVRSILVIWAIIYGIPVMGICPPDQVDFNSVCYQVNNMTGAVDIVTNVEITDFAFFRYEVNQFRQNPAFVSFDMSVSVCSLELTALQLCNEDVPTIGCSWSSLNSGNVTFRSDNDTTFNPTVPNINSTANNCGCNIFGNNTAAAPIWYIRIQNLNSTTQNCTLDFQASSVDVCFERGTFSNGLNITPPATNGSFCLCDDENYGGSQCQFDVTNITVGTSFIANTNPNEVVYFRFEHDNTGFSDLTFNATDISGNCSEAQTRVSYSCGECTPAFPYAYDASFTESFMQTGLNYSQYRSSLAGSFVVSLFQDIRDQCGCNVNHTMEEWYWAIDASQVNGSCSFEVSVSTSPACGNPEGAICGGVGVCTANMCECPSNREGVDCRIATEKPKEIYNGVFYARKIKPRVNVVSRSYVTLSPLTNRNIKIQLQPFSGDAAGYLGAIETEGQPNPTVPINGTLDQNGTMIFLARFSHPPEFDLLIDPVYYPALEVKLDTNTIAYDYAATLQSDSGVSVLIPIDRHTPEKLYITVLSLGTYSVVDSRPLEESDVEFIIYVSLEDNFAALIDIVLMIVFIAIVMFFCIAWKTCPSIFHSTMKKIIPELYYMEYQKKEQEQVERAKISTEVAKTAAYAIAGTVYGLMQALALIPWPEQAVLNDLPKKPTLEATFNLMDNWMKDIQIPVVKLDVIPYNIPPRLLLQMIKTNIPKLSSKVKIPSSLSPADLLNKISKRIPDCDTIEATLSMTSFPGMVGALAAKFPDLTVIKEIGIELTAVGSASIPLVPLPANMDVTSILKGFKASLCQIPGISQDISLFLKIDKLLSLPDIHGLTLQDLGLNVTPVHIPLKLDRIQYPTVKISKFHHDMSLKIDIEVDEPNLGRLRGIDLIFRFIVGAFSISLQNLAFIVIEFMILMFNVAIIHSSFFEYPSIQPDMPNIDEIQAAFSNIAGGLGNFVYVMSGFFKYLDFFFLLDSWNCGGTLTMISPFVFLLGAILTWIILEKDLLLYLAIKLKVHKPNPKSKLSMVANNVWMGISRVMVKATILTLQAVILCLTQAVTKTTTNRTCNDIDLVANTFGKVIVAFFYVFFYTMFFFIFTGAPDWDRYKDMKFLPSVGLVFVDGLYRFGLLTLGIWNDTTVRAFNIIGRSQRYDDDMSDSPVDSAMLRLGLNAPSAVTNMLKHSENTKQMKQALHEQIMHLIAISRTVVWIPLPLCVVIAKFSEALNTAIVFMYVKEEPIKLKRVFPLRIFIWIFHIVQMPLVLSVVFTASKTVTIVLAATLIPMAAFRTVVGWVKLFVELFGNITDVRVAASVIEMADLA